MARQYKWRSTTDYRVLPDPNNQLTHGVTPSDTTNWQTEDIGTTHTSRTWAYWYHDANTSIGGIFSDAQASRVVLSLTQSWTTSVDQMNNLTVSIHTVVDSIVRDDVRGNDTNTPGRNISLYTEEGGTQVLAVTDNLVATAHTIYNGPLDLGTQTFTLAPGTNAQRSSMFMHNQTVGAVSFDDIWVGIQFMNPLPKDYRPGATLHSPEEYYVTSPVWYSNDKTNGACHVRTNSGWQECRTLNGDIDAQGNPPLIYRNNSLYNMKKIGKL